MYFLDEFPCKVLWVGVLVVVDGAERTKVEEGQYE
jgi:hypothetical protein